jgi:glutamate-1-semialdehyde 2,1-aminomutase
MNINLHELIPGGAHTYSKGDDQFPSNAPSYVISGKGSHVLCSDNQTYLDCGMGLASVSLGHANDAINSFVVDSIGNGLNFSRPSILEFTVATKFLSLVKNHDMIKFAKNGSTVTTAAVKLARAYTGKEIVLVPKGHPFYSYDDWYIGSTDCDFGVPESTKVNTVQFESCNLNSLKKVIEAYKGKIACLITEPEKNWCSSCSCPISTREMLNQMIEICKSEGILFILDEMQSGFRLDYPGAITKYNLDVDMATWGKGISNGFSFACLTGKKEIMQLGSIQNAGSRKLFLISTTHGAETTGLSAFLATAKFYEDNQVISKLHSSGNIIIKVMNDLVAKFSLENYLKIYNCNWMPGIKFIDNEFEENYVKTFILQEMLKKNVLFQGNFVVSFAHSDSDIQWFSSALDFALNQFKLFLNGKRSGIQGNLIKPVFRKLI